MGKIFITFIIALYSTLGFCQNGYKQDLNQKANIIFPDTPKARHNKAGILYSLIDHKNIYLAQVTIAEKGLKDMVTSNLEDSVYANIVTGSLNASKGKLLYKKKIKVKGLRGIEFGLTSKIDSQNYYKYHQAFYFNETIILYGFWTTDSTRNSEDLKRFFNSFKLAIKSEEVIQGNAKELGHKTGKIIAEFLLIVFIALIGLGLVIILRKIIYNNNG
jgi:hypothetical protein